MFVRISILLASLSALANTRASPSVGSEAFFEEQVAPILETECYGCHSHASKKAKGGLVVDSLKGLILGGDSGSAIVPGDAKNSLVVHAVLRRDEATAMPPESPLKENQVAVLSAWIDAGAPWPESARTAPEPVSDAEKAAHHWAYQPVVTPVLPELTDPEWAAWAKTPIDKFIAEKLAKTTAEPGAEADPRTLLRRLNFGLTGLPPSPGESISPDTIDLLLASQEYGRKWGRHWLDVARYADTAGDNADFPIPEMALYRDYVVDAFNADLPFDEFIKEQLAGDLMDSGNDADLRRRRVIATSFVANSMRFCDDLKKDVPLVIHDTVEAVGQAFLGTTLSCARCHDHKYDPIPTSDYYGIYGYFESTRYPYAGREGRQLPFQLVPTGLDHSANRRVEEINRTVASEIINGGRISLKGDQGKKLIGLLTEQRGLAEMAFGVTDAVETGDSPVHAKGRANKRGSIAPRGFLSAISDAPPEIPEGESGRLELAEWIASGENPLTARVIANRVWLWHFGRALAPTPNNLGTNAPEPSHPELLDYLASKLVGSGWSIKALHREILASATYRQAWRPDSAAPATDTANSLWWRFDRRRLTAEEVRDAALFVSGHLDLANPGKHPFPALGEMKFTQHRPYAPEFEHDHRSLYLITSRIRKNEFLTLFDGADPTRSTGVRHNSTVPLQALYLMNSARFTSISEGLAARLDQSRPIADRIAQAYSLCFQRPPTLDETARITTAVSLIEENPWPTVARALLLSNEFFYLD